MAEYTDEQREGLGERWKGHEEALAALVPVIKENPDWEESDEYTVLMQALGDLPGGVEPVAKDLRGVDLAKVKLSGAKLQGADLSFANLEGAGLFRANLESAMLLEANLSKADLQSAKLSGAKLWRANLSEAKLQYTNLSKADLADANLFGARLWWANLSGADLGGAILYGANLRRADLSGATFHKTKYTTDEILDRLRRYWIPRLLKWFSTAPGFHLIEWNPPRKACGITDFSYTDTTKVDGSTNPILKRHMEDYQFIQAFREKGWFHRWIAYPLWKISCDCGRSLVLWVFWSALFALFFGHIYSSHLDWFKGGDQLAKFDAYYFSVVTFTTLGFGDVTPLPGNATAQAWIMAEVVIG